MTPKRAIGGKTLNSGIRGGLWDAKHYEKMGDAVWLFGWLVLRQTTERNGSGLVLRGKALTYVEITADTGWPRRTLQRWMARLQEGGYVCVKHSAYSRMVITILNAKKFGPKQLGLPLSSAPDVAQTSAPGVAQMGTKSGALKEERKTEQKLPGSKDNGAPSAAGQFGQSPPDGIPIRTWAAFVEMRRKIGRPLTEHAVDLVFRKLAALKAMGNDPVEVLEQSIMHSWTGLFQVKEDGRGKNGSGPLKGDALLEHNLRAAGFRN
jgi:hypothetical protein